MQTRVYREFSWQQTLGLGLFLIHLEQNTVRIESLDHGKRLRLWVELGLKTDSCNPKYLFVKKLISL